MQMFLMIVGLMTICYILQYLLLSIKCFDKGNGKTNILLYPLLAIVLICILCSGPIQLLMHLYDERKEKEFKDKAYESGKKHREVIDSILDGNEIKITQLASENAALKEQLIEEHFKAKEEGTLYGERRGFRSGYKAGFYSCFRQVGLDKKLFSKMLYDTYEYDRDCFVREQLKQQQELDSLD